MGESPYKIKLDNVGKKTIFDLRYEMKLEMNLFEANLVQLTSEEKKNGPSDITINEMNNILSNPVNKSLNCSRPSLNFQRKTFGMEVKMSIAVKRPGKCERRFTLFQTEFKLDNFFANLMKNAEAFKDEALDFFKEATDKNISDILDKLDKQNISHKIKINNCLNLLLAKVCFTGDLHINGNLNFSTIPKDFLQKNSQAIHKFFQRVSLSKRDFKKVTIPRPTNVLCSNLGEKLNLIYVPKLDCQIKKRIVRYDNKRTCRKIVFWTKCSNKQVPVYGDYYFCYTDSGTKTYTLATGNKQKEIRDKIVKKNEMIKKLANNAQGILDTYERDVKKALDIMQPLDVKNILSDMDLNVIIDFSGNLDFGGNITMMVDIAWTDDLDFGVRYVFLLFFYCFFIVFLLFFYCFFIVFYCFFIVFLLFFYCFFIVFLLFFYCFFIVFLLFFYCFFIVFLLFFYCFFIVFLLFFYCFFIVFLLFFYCFFIVFLFFLLFFILFILKI